jgi:DNA polymerase elongation subunit (family B)
MVEVKPESKLVKKLKSIKSVKDERPNEPVKEKHKLKNSKEIPEEIKKEIPKDDSNFEFMITDICHYEDREEDELKYNISLFGRTQDDKDVTLKVTGFTPFFYIEVPNNWQSHDADVFVDGLKKKMKWRCENNDRFDYDLSESLLKYKLVKKHKFYHFTNKKLYNFLMLVFKSNTAMREYSNMLSRPISIQGIKYGKKMSYARYESNIESHIRFLHIQNLSAAGWVSIDKNKLKAIPEYSSTDYSYKVHYNHVLPSNNNDRIAPLKIMGYDIECISCDEQFPIATRINDKIIQIGITMYRYGEGDAYDKIILCVGKCDPVEGTTVECYKTERAMIKAFAKKIAEIRPDIICGYNSFGFDDEYIWDRINLFDQKQAEKQGIDIELMENKLSDEVLAIMSKLNTKYLTEVEQIPKPLTHFEVKNLSSSALGDNVLSFFQIPGIVSVDMLKVCQKEFRMDSYKLDNVSSTFIKEKINKITDELGDKIPDDENSKIPIKIYCNKAKALEEKSYIQLMVDDAYLVSPLVENAKYYVNKIETITEIVKVKDKEGKETDKEISYKCIHTKINYKHLKELREVFEQMKDNSFIELFWAFSKDEMDYKKIREYFESQNTKHIAKVAKYCVKDCKLVCALMNKLDIIVNAIAMANVCCVPTSYLFLRGQGVKILSLVARTCRLKNYLIPTLQKDEQEQLETYEGACVIEPKPNVYFTPIGVLDYSSLYPKSMCERNLSPECYIDNTRRDYLELINLPGYKYHTIYVVKKDEEGKIIRNIDGTPKKVKHTFIQELDKDGKPIYGILPEILTKLLQARDDTKARMKTTSDPFVLAILNGLQLAFKVVANSLYGQTGAGTSAIFFYAIAESTTAIGRERLHFAKKIVEENFENAKIIYGDTDSIFINFNLKDKDGNERTDKSALKETIELAKKAADLINSKLPPPQKIVYEKTLHPFILVTKKRYVGFLYEQNENVIEEIKFMGIVLKRRDNAPIVKIVIRGIIDSILKHRDVNKAIQYTKEEIHKLMSGFYPIEKFIVSKTLKARYKKPNTIAHKVLADRIALRDPGNKPQVNDRIRYVNVVRKFTKEQLKKGVLQGEMIETPEYIQEHNLKIDYMHYLTNQIQVPASQFLELMIPKRKVDKLFNSFIKEEEGKRLGRGDITKWLDKDGVSSESETGNTKSLEKEENEVYEVGKHQIKEKIKYDKPNMEIWLHKNKDKLKDLVELDPNVEVSKQKKKTKKRKEAPKLRPKKTFDQFLEKSEEINCN